MQEITQENIENNEENALPIIEALTVGERFTSPIMQLASDLDIKKANKSDQYDRNKEYEGTTQLKEGSEWYGLKEDIIIPPYDLDLLSEMPEMNTRLNRLLRVKARNIAGLGWVISPNKSHTKLSDQEKRVYEEEKRIAEDFFDNCNPDMTFTQLCYQLKYDEQCIGSGYLEVVRDIATGKVKELYYLPSNTIRVRKDQKGFVQQRYGKKVFFKNYGDQDVYDCFTGINVTELGEEKEYLTKTIKNLSEGMLELYKANPLPENNSPLPMKRRANEVVQIKVHNNFSQSYGVPIWTCSIPAILGNRSNAIRNLAFFDNDATPRMAIIIKGGTLDPETKTNLEDFMRVQGKGPTKAHRIIILQLKQPSPQLKAPEIVFEKMTVTKTDDQSHSSYRHDNDEEIREAFGISKIFLGTADDVNRASATIAKQVTNQQEFEPEIVELEHIFTQKFIRQGLGLKNIKMTLKRPKVSDDVEQSVIEKSRTLTASITPNEIRESRGEDPYPEEYTWANKPIRVAEKELELGINNLSDLEELNDFQAEKIVDILRKSKFKLEGEIEKVYTGEMDEINSVLEFS